MRRLSRTSITRIGAAVRKVEAAAGGLSAMGDSPRSNLFRLLKVTAITEGSPLANKPYRYAVGIYPAKWDDAEELREAITAPEAGELWTNEPLSVGDEVLALKVGGHWEAFGLAVEGDANEDEPRTSESVLRRDSDSRLELWGIQTPATYPLVVEANAKVVVNEIIDGVQKIRYADFADLKGEDGAAGQDGLLEAEVKVIWCDMWRPDDLPDGDWLQYDPALHTGWECDYPGGWVALINRLIDEGIIVGFWKTGDADGSTTIGKIIKDSTHEESRINLFADFYGNPALLGNWAVEGVDAENDPENCFLLVRGGTEIWHNLKVGSPFSDFGSANIEIMDGGVIEIAGKQVVGNQEAAIADAPVDAKADYVAADVDTDQEVADALNALAGKVNAVGGKVNDILAALRSHGLIATPAP